MSLTPTALIAALADGRFHTGELLGERFGVSKAAIWKALKKLDEFGVDVHSVRGKGYRLSEPLTLLNAAHIESNIAPARRAELGGIEVLQRVDSTNSHVLRAVQDGTLTLGGVLQHGMPHGTPTLSQARCHATFAESQTAGKGRRGRSWVSPYGHNLYLSLVRAYNHGAGALDGLSLVVGVALVGALADLGYRGLRLKWPNDVLLGERKLAGILLEISGDLSGLCHVVIGVGLNLKSAPAAMAEVDQPWAALDQLGYRHTQRNVVAGALLNKLLTALQMFEQAGFAPFMERWKEYDLTCGRELALHTPLETVQGIGQGVNESGALLLATEQGLRTFHGGEVSLRWLD